MYKNIPYQIMRTLSIIGSISIYLHDIKYYGRILDDEQTHLNVLHQVIYKVQNTAIYTIN